MNSSGVHVFQTTIMGRAFRTSLHVYLGSCGADGRLIHFNPTQNVSPQGGAAATGDGPLSPSDALGQDHPSRCTAKKGLSSLGFAAVSVKGWRDGRLTLPIKATHTYTNKLCHVTEQQYRKSRETVVSIRS